ncbi:MAG: universal stress protein [Candidatus Eiseniibacteriota bacterium]
MVLIAIPRILVGIDGSKSSNDAANYAISIARRFGSQVTLLHVVPPFSKIGHSSGISGLVPPRFFTQAKEEAEMWFVEIRKRAVELQKPVLSKIISTASSPGLEIAKFGEREKVDLIVVGTKGKTGLKRALLGSTAGDVVKYSSSPVLVVK